MCTPMQLTTMAMLQSMLMQVQAAENGRSLLQSTMMVQTSSSRSTTLLKEGVPSEDNLEGFTLKHENALTQSRRSLLKMMQMKFIASATHFAGKIISRGMMNAMKSSELASSQRTWKYATQQIIIEQTMPELITCSTDPTTRIAECIPAPNAKTMHN